jgi:hypothetical protein
LSLLLLSPLLASSTSCEQAFINLNVSSWVHLPHPIYLHLSDKHKNASCPSQRLFGQLASKDTWEHTRHNTWKTNNSRSLHSAKLMSLP